MSNYMQHHIYSYKVLTGTVNVVNLCGKQIYTILLELACVMRQYCDSLVCASLVYVQM